MLKGGAAALQPYRPWANRPDQAPQSAAAGADGGRLQPLVSPVPLPPAPPLTALPLADGATAATALDPAGPATPADAAAEAEALLAAARAEAEAIRQEAIAEAEALHRSAWDEGHAAGLAAGRAEAEAELKAAMLEVEGMRRTVTAQRDNLLATAQNELLALAVTLARRIVVAELSLRPELIVDMVAEALQQLRAGADPKVYAHPDDIERLDNPPPGPRRQQIAGNVELVPDVSLDPGEFVIKSRHGQIEGRRKREFAELVAFLQEVGEARPWP